MSGRRDCKWYVEPRDPFTNRVIAELLEHSGIADVDAQPSVLCDDGAHRALWSCSHATIAELDRSRMKGLDYFVWVAEGRGKPRRWTFSKKGKGKKPAV